MLRNEPAEIVCSLFHQDYGRQARTAGFFPLAPGYRFVLIPVLAAEAGAYQENKSVAAPNHGQACIMRGHARFNRKVRILAASNDSTRLLQSFGELFSDTLQIVNSRTDEDLKFCRHIASLFAKIFLRLLPLGPYFISEFVFSPRARSRGNLIRRGNIEIHAIRCEYPNKSHTETKSSLPGFFEPNEKMTRELLSLTARMPLTLS